VSNDSESLVRGSEKIFTAFQQQLQQYGLTEEVSLSMVGDLGYSFA